MSAWRSQQLERDYLDKLRSAVEQRQRTLADWSQPTARPRPEAEFAKLREEIANAEAALADEEAKQGVKTVGVRHVTREEVAKLHTQEVRSKTVTDLFGVIRQRDERIRELESQVASLQGLLQIARERLARHADDGGLPDLDA